MQCLVAKISLISFGHDAGSEFSSPPPPPFFFLGGGGSIYSFSARLSSIIVQELCESRGSRPGLSVLKPVLNWANVCSPEHTSETSTNYDSFLN